MGENGSFKRQVAAVCSGVETNMTNGLGVLLKRQDKTDKNGVFLSVFYTGTSLEFSTLLFQ